MRIFLVGLSLLLLSFFTRQQAAAQSRLKNSNYLETHGGFSGLGLYGSVYYSALFNRTVIGKVGGSFSYGRHHNLHFRRFYLDALGAFKIHKYGRVMVTNALLGMSLNGDYPGEIQSDELDKSFYLDYGLMAGLETEFEVSRDVLFLVTGNYRYYLQGRFSHWQYQVGLGLRFVL